MYRYVYRLVQPNTANFEAALVNTAPQSEIFSSYDAQLSYFRCNIADIASHVSIPYFALDYGVKKMMFAHFKT